MLHLEFGLRLNECPDLAQGVRTRIDGESFAVRVDIEAVAMDVHDSREADIPRNEVPAIEKRLAVVEREHKSSARFQYPLDFRDDRINSMHVACSTETHRDERDRVIGLRNSEVEVGFSEFRVLDLLAGRLNLGDFKHVRTNVVAHYALKGRGHVTGERSGPAAEIQHEFTIRQVCDFANEQLPLELKVGVRRGIGLVVADVINRRYTFRESE